MRRAGDVIDGHRLVERVGDGHFGEVWKADYRGSHVALKIFSRPYRIAGIRRETLAQYALGQLPYPASEFFPAVEHINLEHDPPYVRMEFVDGVPLESVIGRPTLGLADRLAIGGQILEALACVHAQEFVHGDLSPMNVMVSRRGADGPGRVQLIDVGFGAMFEDGAEDMTKSDEGPPPERPFGVASPLYAAPERFKSDFLDGCGKAADVFSAGKILYRLITGESPFIVKPVTRKFPSLGPSWDEFIFKCLEDRPEERYPDAAAALAAFRALGRAPTSTRPLRTECPECDLKIAIGAAGVGDAIACGGCGAAMEILHIDERTGFADAGVVGTGDPSIDPDVVIEEARKFCPSCGERIQMEAQKCRHCGAWVEECVRVLEQRSDERVREAEVARVERVNYWVPAVFTFLMYLVCWLPGAILNLHFLSDANRQEAVLGERPDGATPLHVMVWLFVYMPLIFLVSIIVFGLLGSLVR